MAGSPAAPRRGLSQGGRPTGEEAGGLRWAGEGSLILPQQPRLLSSFSSSSAFSNENGVFYGGRGCEEAEGPLHGPVFLRRAARYPALSLSLAEDGNASTCPQNRLLCPRGVLRSRRLLSH